MERHITYIIGRTIWNAGGLLGLDGVWGLDAGMAEIVAQEAAEGFMRGLTGVYAANVG